MRVLVTNDDGVDAPGIAALAAAAVQAGYEVVVVAPLADYSGASAAVGPVHTREGIDYEGRTLAGLSDVPAFGVDGPPALAVILACVGSFGPRPDLVLSGINHGANVGRSVLHSGTVGAALTAAHFGLPALAVSLRFGPPPVPWSTATATAMSLLPTLATAPPGTVLNLNVPDIPAEALRGVRHGAIGRTGTIRSAVHAGDAPPGQPGQPDGDGAPGDRRHAHVQLPPFEGGTLRLDLVPPATVADPEDLATDAALVANGFASLTALVGVRDAGADVVTPFLRTLDPSAPQGG